MTQTDGTQADGYYDENDMGKDELDLSFLNEDDKSSDDSTSSSQTPKK